MDRSRARKLTDGLYLRAGSCWPLGRRSAGNQVACGRNQESLRHVKDGEAPEAPATAVVLAASPEMLVGERLRAQADEDEDVGNRFVPEDKRSAPQRSGGSLRTPVLADLDRVVQPCVLAVKSAEGPLPPPTRRRTPGGIREAVAAPASRP